MNECVERINPFTRVAAWFDYAKPPGLLHIPELPNERFAHY